MRFLQRAFVLLVVLVFGACSSSRTPFTQRELARGVPEVPGGRSDGSVMLPNLWSLRPVGRQIALGDFPVNIAVSPNGRYAAVLHSGNSEHEIVVVDLKSNSVGIVSRALVSESFYGLTFSPDGKQLFCSGAGDEVVHRFTFADGYLSEHRPILLRDAKERSVPSGVAVSRDGNSLFVANLLGHRVSYVDLSGANTNVLETLFSTNALLVFATNSTATEDEAAITKRAEAALEDARSNQPYPYACVVDDKRGRLYVSFWAQARVGVIDLTNRKLVAQWATEEHPNEM